MKPSHIKAVLSILATISAISSLQSHVRVSDPLKLTLDSAINYSVEHNRALQNSRLAIEKSKMQVKEAIATGLPQVQATLDYQNFMGAKATLQFGPMPATIEFNPTSNIQATVSQLLFNGSYFVGIQISKLAKVITEKAYEKDEQNVKEQTIKAFYLVLVSERLLETISKNRDNIADIFAKTTNMVEQGVLEPIEAKKISVMISTVDNAIKATERQVELAYNLMRMQLGIDAQQPIKMDNTLEELIERYLHPKIALDNSDLSNNIEYRMVELQNQMAIKNLNMKRSSFLPTLSGFYSYTEKIKKPMFDMSPKNIIGISLNVPIFSGGKRYMQLSQAKVDLTTAQNTLLIMQEQLTLQERQLRYAYQNLFEQYQNQQTNVSIAKEVLENLTHKLEQGVISGLELTNANNEYLKAESSATSTLLELLNAELALRKLYNKL